MTVATTSNEKISTSAQERCGLVPKGSLSLTDAFDEEPLHRLRTSLALFDTSEYAIISEAKNILQELLVENNLPLPKYATDFQGPTNDRVFEGTVTVQYSYGGHTMVAKGEPELTKKDAEKSAAFSVLRKLKCAREVSVRRSASCK